MTSIIQRAEKAAAKIRSNQLFAVLAGSFLLAAAPAFGRQLTISGTVRDAGGAVSGVAVTLRTPTGAKNQTRTDAQGKYSFASLISGPYELSFAREGFEKAVRTLTLAGESSTEDVTLAVGSISSSVEVIDVGGKNYECAINAENLLNRQRYFVSQINGRQLYPGQSIDVLATMRYRF